MHLPDFNGNLSSGILLSRLTTWKIGGPADWFAEPDSLPDLELLLQTLNNQNISWFILGNGSNILFSDAGFRGVVIRLGTKFKTVKIKDSKVIADAGVQLSVFSRLLAEKGLAGMEAFVGIPGTLGGAAFVNAGAFNQSILTNCVKVEGFSKNLCFKTITDIRSGYRSGGFPDDFIITRLHFNLTPDDPSRIHQLMNQYLEHRRSTQPLSEASAGCTFKNPENSGAGRLIDDLGLKGFQNGRAMISTKHANFIINCGNASSSEVIKLIEHVRSKVSDNYGVKLELEVLILDENGNRINPNGAIR